MTVLLYASIAALSYGLAVAVVFRGVPAAVTGLRWVLRRTIGARPRRPRHATTSGKGAARNV